MAFNHGLIVKGEQRSVGSSSPYTVRSGKVLFKWGLHTRNVRQQKTYQEPNEICDCQPVFNISETALISGIVIGGFRPLCRLTAMSSGEVEVVSGMRRRHPFDWVFLFGGKIETLPVSAPNRMKVNLQ